MQQQFSFCSTHLFSDGNVSDGNVRKNTRRRCIAVAEGFSALRALKDQLRILKDADEEAQLVSCPAWQPISLPMAYTNVPFWNLYFVDPE